MADRHTYENRRIALLTQHGKQQVIAPVLEPALGCVMEHVTGFDTDQLGTFTRDIPRLGSQIEAARRKARMGMELSGRTAGVASEGSFGVDPFTGMVPWNVELLVWLDAELGIEVVGMAQGTARSGHIHSGQWHEIEAFAQREDFPHHQLVLRPESQDDSRIQKSLSEILCVRHSMSTRSMNATQDQTHRFGGPGGSVRISVCEAVESVTQS